MVLMTFFPSTKNPAKNSSLTASAAAAAISAEEAAASALAAQVSLEGATGPIGLTGPQGEQGDTGATGAAGSSSNPERVTALSKAAFFAVAQDRVRNSAGSGFIEWGKTTNELEVEPVNEGLHAKTTLPNALFLAGGNGFADSAVSRSDSPLVTVNGVQSQIEFVVQGSDSNTRNVFSFPPAPMGNKTYDSASGVLVEHANSSIAFAAETATNKVITSRQDLVILESWHEKISDKDVVYPLGNVQYGVATWEGIALSSSVAAQGYSAFGEWDTTTVGYGVVWSTLSDTDKALFAGNFASNIYYDGSEAIQVRYRIRVIEGLGDGWKQIVPTTGENEGSNNNFLHYDIASGSETLQLILPRGKKDTVDDYTLDTVSGSYNAYREVNGQYKARLTWQNDNTSVGHIGLCFAIPIVLVQRRNQGAYHPALNPEGCSKIQSVGGGSSNSWYEVNAYISTSTVDCFEQRSLTQDGVIGDTSGRSDGKFYNAIYASDVQDLRMSSKRLPLKEIREKCHRMAIAGKIRGFEGVPFTKVFGVVTGTTYTGNPVRTWIDIAGGGLSDFFGITDGDVEGILSVDGFVYKLVHIASDGTALVSSMHGDVGGDVAGKVVIISKLQPHSQVNPTWTDIIGNPSDIADTFPDGVEGQWIANQSEAFYSPLTASYDSADFTSVELINTDTISFHVKGLTTSATEQYILGGSVESTFIYYQGSTGNLRLVDDSGNITDATVGELSDGDDYYVELRLNPTGWDLYLDGVFKVTAVGTVGDVTLDTIGEDGAGTSMTIGTVYGVTLGGLASWPMQVNNNSIFDDEDMIGSNNLTYNGKPVPVTSSDTLSTKQLGVSTDILSPWEYFPLNRKCLGNGAGNKYAYSTDAGVTWDFGNTVAGGDDKGINPINNTIRLTLASDQITLIQYETQAHFTKDDVNSKVLDLGSVWVGSRHSEKLMSTLINKVPISDVLPYLAIQTVLQSYGVDENSPEFLESIYVPPTHNSVTPAGITKAIKVLDYLSVENNISKFCYIYKEMIYDTTWGDNSKFEINDNQATVTDDNGNSVLVGTASFKTQYFLVKE